MGKIQQLSAHVADLIAAGEVVERPASAAKELVENAIDAGAKNITVEMQEGGMRFLRVTDDGCGMSPEDAKTAFLRHATSKLRTASDLEAISTLGFRGEALAAISAVSRIDLLTRPQGADFGTALHLEAGQITEEGEAGCPVGTTIIIRDLFYNTPARMKFMKRDSVEAAALLSAVQKLALAHPEISLRVIRDGYEQLRTVGDGQLLSAVRAVMGKVTAKEMLPLKSAWEKYSLHGFVSTPIASRGNRSNEIFFVNGRHVRSKTMTAALEEAYANRIMQGRFPSCVLHLQLPEHLVDVNVHPAKIEVKFLNEKDVFDTVLYGVRGVLDQAPGRAELRMGGRVREDRSDLTAAPSYMAAQDAPRGGQRPEGSAPVSHGKAVPRSDFYRNMTGEEFLSFAGALKNAPKSDSEQAKNNARQVLQALQQSGPSAKKETTRPKLPTEQELREAAARGVLYPTQGAVRPEEAVPTVPTGEQRPHKTPPAPAQEKKPTAAAPAQPASESSALTAQPAASVTPPSLPTEEAPLPLSMEEGQQQLPLTARNYSIIGEALNTYIIVEQGQELLFIDKHAAHERILFERLRASQEPIMSQLLLQPLIYRLEPEQAALLLENERILSEFGFILSDFGDGVLSVSQIPSELSPEQVESTLCDFARQLRHGRQPDKTALRDSLLHSLACKAAIKGGQYSDPLERRILVEQVLSREDLKYCPHGRPICAVLSRSQLERQFKRS